MKKITLLFFVMFNVFTSLAQTKEGQIGTGNTLNNDLPINANYTYNYSQQIYLKNEISAALGENKFITKIKFYYKGESGMEHNYNKWAVYIGNTTVNNFANSVNAADSDIVPISYNNLYDVFDGIVNFTTTTEGWVEIELQTPFLWDGTSNIVVAVKEYSFGTNDKLQFRTFDTDLVRGIGYGGYYGVIEPWGPSINDGINKKMFVPQIIFVAEKEAKCLTPTKVNVDEVLAKTATINWNSGQDTSVLGYEYELRTSGEPGSGATGLVNSGSVAATVFTAAQSGLEENTEYKVYVRSKCSATEFSDWTKAVGFKTACDLPELILKDIIMCGSSEVTLEAIVDTDNVRWYDYEYYGDPIATGKTFKTPLLTETQSYWVDVFVGDPNKPDCVSSKKEIIVTVNPAPYLELSHEDFLICGGESTEALTINSGADDYDTYTWSPKEGVSGDNKTGWTFNPNESTEYILTASQSNDYCHTSEKVMVKVNPKPEISINVEETDVLVCDGDIKKFEIKNYTAASEVVIGTDRTYTKVDDPEYGEHFSAFNQTGDQVRIQLIYTKEELIDAGFSAGEINSISFEINSLGGQATNDDYTVKIGTHEYMEMFGYNFFNNAEFVTVYGPSTYTHTASGWQEIEFTTPYVWDGDSNLIIELSYKGNKLNAGSNAETFYTLKEYYSIIGKFGAGETERSSYRFNTKFKRISTYEMKWSPIENLYTDEAATIPYEGDSQAIVFYKLAEEKSNLNLTVTTDRGCQLVKDYNISTAIVSDESIQKQQKLEDDKFIKDIDVNQQDVTWFKTEEDANNGVNILDNNKALEAGIYYGVLKTAQGCVGLPFAVTIELTAGINDFDLSKFNYYPNPVEDVLTITYSDVIDSVEVYSLSGQRVLSLNSSSNEVKVDMSQLPSSIYVINVISANSSKTIKVVKK